MAASAADSLSYTYVEGGYNRLALDTNGTGNFDFDGRYLRGSAALTNSFYVLGSFARATNNDFGTDIDLNEQHIGLGWHKPVSARADFLVEAGYLRQELDAGSFGSTSGDGGRLSAGMRGGLASNFEGWAKANYVDGGDFNGDFSGTLGAQLKFNKTRGVVGEAEFASDSNRYLIGLRASF